MADVAKPELGRLLEHLMRLLREKYKDGAFDDVRIRLYRMN